MKRLALAPVLIAIAACSPAPAVTPVVAPPAEAAPPVQAPAIGMLEDRPGSTTGEPARFVVRMMFHKDGAGWKSLNPDCADEACLASAPTRLPPTATWTIVYQGQTKGVVNAITPAAWKLYADVGTQELANGSLIRTVGDRTSEFSEDDSTPLYRPLVAISVPTVSDPDVWKSGALSPEALTSLRVAFRAQFATASNCATEGGSDLKPMTYTDANVAPSGVWVSAKGWSIATTQLDGYRCDGPSEETAFASQTFAISPDGKAKYLGESLKLVDAGDFDGDGKPEMIFAIARGNTAGYDLYFDDFAGQATFAFNYH